jgi:RNA recognition motif-containing protein
VAAHLEIFIKYLPSWTVEKDLRELFEPCGPMDEPVLMRDTSTGMCKGVGWITFHDEASFRKAMAMNGAQMGGRHLAISHATVRRNGVDWFQRVPKAVLDFAQVSNRRTTQAGLVVIDFVQDGLQSGALNTAMVVGPDGKAVAVDDVDVRIQTTAADTLTIYTEMYTTNDRI